MEAVFENEFVLIILRVIEYNPELPAVPRTQTSCERVLRKLMSIQCK